MTADPRGARARTSETAPKEAVRARLRLRRASVPLPEGDRTARALALSKDAAVVACYLSVPPEPDTHRLADQLLANGCRVLVPVLRRRTGARPLPLPSDFPLPPSDLSPLPSDLSPLPSDLSPLPSDLPSLPSNLPPLPSNLPPLRSPSNLPPLPSGIPTQPSPTPGSASPSTPPPPASPSTSPSPASPFTPPPSASPSTPPSSASPFTPPSPEWAWYTGPDDLRPGWRGIPEPTSSPLGPEALAQAEWIWVSGLAGTARGDRLGTGGGWYDRALAYASPTAHIGMLLHDGELLDSVPTDPWDRRVHVILTASETLWTAE